MTDEILTVYETADYLKLSDKTIRRLISDNSLVASKIGSTWRIRKTDIDEYLKTTTNRHRSDAQCKEQSI